MSLGENIFWIELQSSDLKFCDWDIKDPALKNTVSSIWAECKYNQVKNWLIWPNLWMIEIFKVSGKPMQPHFQDFEYLNEDFETSVWTYDLFKNSRSRLTQILFWWISPNDKQWPTMIHRILDKQKCFGKKVQKLNVCVIFSWMCHNFFQCLNLSLLEHGLRQLGLLFETKATSQSCSKICVKTERFLAPAVYFSNCSLEDYFLKSNWLISFHPFSSSTKAT